LGKGGVSLRRLSSKPRQHMAPMVLPAKENSKDTNLLFFCVYIEIKYGLVFCDVP
jgi:hypothetical protein